MLPIRTIDLIYRDSPDLERICPREDVLKHFRLYEHQRTWRGKSNEFMEELRKEKELSEYHRLHRRDYRTTASNRHRMDHSQEEYERLFTNIFKGTEDAYCMYHFDVQFSGSDYENDPDWLAQRAFLRQHGSDMVFFPYTQSTSSTEIKEQLSGVT